MGAATRGTHSRANDNANHLSRSPRFVRYRPSSCRLVQPAQWCHCHPTSSSKLETDENRTRWPTNHWFHWFPMDCGVEEAANISSLGDLQTSSTFTVRHAIPPLPGSSNPRLPQNLSRIHNYAYGQNQPEQS